MKIARLVLARYGHLTDVELNFPLDFPLHVVLGANEAGKSTALSAIGDALFRFPHLTQYGFLHDQSDLRVAFDLVAADGVTKTFVRSKRRKDDLADESGNVLPETSLAPFLGGANREFFKRMFGLNGAELRSGGNDILAGKGEVGSSIFEASTGMRGLSAALEKIRGQADSLYTPRRVASRAFYQLTDAFRQARQDLETRSIRPETYENLRAEQARLQAELAENAEQERARKTERRRLERIRRTLPALRALERARIDMLAMGEVPALPADAEQRRQEAVLQRETAADAIARDLARREALAVAVDALAPDAALLREADTIDALEKDLRRIEGARGDRGKRRIEAEQHARAIVQAARDLGVTGAAEEIVEKMPTGLARAAARRVMSEHAGIKQLFASTEAALVAARRDAEAEEAALAGAEAPPDPAPLRDAIDAAKSEGRLDDDFVRARDELAAAERDLLRALGAVAPWHGDAAALAAAPVPSNAALRQHRETLSQAETTARDARKHLDVISRDLGAAKNRLVEITHGDALPTEAAIAAARDRRDAIWRLIRRHHVEAGAAPRSDELRALALAPPLADALEAALREADRLADRRASEAKRLSDFEQTQATRARLEAEHALASDALAAAEAVLAERRGAWVAAWQPTGIVPGDPAAMTEWLVSRKTALDALAARDKAAAVLRALETRRSNACADLSAHLPATETGDGRLRTLLRAAETLFAARDAAARAFREQINSAAQARDAAEKAARAHADALERRQAWDRERREVLDGIGLPAATDPAEAEAAIVAWERIAGEARSWHTARERIAEMTADIDAFGAKTEAMVARAAPDLAGQPPTVAVPAIAARLAITRDQTKEKARQAAELKNLDEAIARTRERHAAAESQLAALRRLAGVDDDDALVLAIARARAHEVLARECAHRADELATQGDGIAIEVLKADAADADPDALAARVEDIDRALGAITDQTIEAERALARVNDELIRLEAGQNAAEAAQRMENFAAEAAETASRYARLRLAAECLRAGLEKFRREQQDPLLRRAGEHFSRLSLKRYARLEIVEDDRGTPSIVATRPDGTRCPVAALSEGTRDQLYLALRVAALEDFCARAEPLPFIADDLLVNFDDDRARAALTVLGDLGAVTQTILFTHHEHIAAMVDPAFGVVHRLPGVSAAVA